MLTYAVAYKSQAVAAGPWMFGQQMQVIAAPQPVVGTSDPNITAAMNAAQAAVLASGAVSCVIIGAILCQ